MWIMRRFEPGDRASRGPAGARLPGVIRGVRDSGWSRLGALSGVAALAALATTHEPVMPRAEASSRPGVILSANFRSSSLPAGWTFDRSGVWSVRKGRLHARLPDEKQEKSFAYFGNDNWKDYQVDLDVCGLRGVDKGVAVRNQGEEAVGIDLRGPGYDDVVMYRGYSQLGKAPVINRNGRWHHVRIIVRGGRYLVYVNRRLRIDYIDQDNQRPAGRLALAAYTGGAGECEILFDNVVVRALR